MTGQREAGYGRSGWTWASETMYNLVVGIVATAVGIVALVAHRNELAVSVGAVFLAAGALLVGTFARARSRRS